MQGHVQSARASWAELVGVGLVGIALLAAPGAVWAQAAATAEAPVAAAATLPEVASISASLQPFIDSQELAGAVALVTQGDRIVHLGAVGWADISAQRPMQTDAVFSIMSMTKPISAVAALILCDEGKLSLDEPIKRHLGDFTGDPDGKITLRHLLTHTSGLFSDQRNRGTLAETVAALATQKLNFEPGSRWLYSPGLTVAGRLVEVASGQPFDRFVAERITQPLGMTDTTFYPSDEQLARLAKTYAANSKTKSLDEPKFDFFGPKATRSPNPSGGLYSTAADLARFYQMLLGRGERQGVRILSSAMVEEMLRPQTGELKAGFVPGSTWGLGVGLVTQPEGVTAMLSPGTFGHGGMLGTQAWADPQRKAVFILLIQRLGLANGDGSPFRQAFQQAAVEVLDAQPPADDAAQTAAPVTWETLGELKPNRADEPVAAAFSAAQARHFLDTSSLTWQKRHNCLTCHTNYLYLMARPALGADDEAHRVVREFAEKLVTERWPEKGPRWDAEVVMTALVLAANDRQTTGSLHPTTRVALDRMWSVQLADGGFDWLKCDWPPMESDDQFGAPMAALAVSMAPDDYAATPLAAAGIEKLRGYLRQTPPPMLHHRAMWLWADTFRPGWISAEERAACLDALLALQHDDGGWSIATLGDWSRADGTEQDRVTSDGYATGLVIYLARRAGIEPSDPRLARGVAWLKSHQRQSGRWFTRSLHQDGNHFLSHAGSSLAVMGLAACDELD